MMFAGSSQRLGSRIMLVMAAVLIATSLLFLAVFAPLYRQEILNERQAVSTKLSAMLQITLESAMLKRDLEGLRAIVDQLGHMPNVALVMILNPNGEARFASDLGVLGNTYPLADICPGCGGAKGDDTRTGFLRNEIGVDVMRSVRPVANREPCTQCHGPVAGHPVNGVLVVDYIAADLKNQTWSIATALAGAGLLVVAGALAATWLALQRAVLRPVGVLAGAVRDFAHMDFSARHRLLETSRGRYDEIADLGRGFDEMAGQLEKTIGEMRERDVFQQALIDAIPDGVRVIADDYSVIAANAEFCRQVGTSLQEVLSVPCYTSSHGLTEPCIPTLVICPLSETGKRDGQIRCSHTHVNRTTGERYAAEVVAAPLLMPNRMDKRRLIVEAIRDLSRQVQVSQEQRLSELGQLAAGVAHEINNPLASIRLGLGAIQRGVGGKCLDDETREFMSAVNAEVDRCLTVTERLMRLSRIPDERGSLVDLARVARDSFALLRYEAELRAVTMKLDMTEELPIIASEGDIGMVLLNLMQNALHAMPAGGLLTVFARISEAHDIEVIVRDTGVGIAPEHLALIFHPFWSWRADGSSGSGLGLAICKSLVVKWGGKIGVSSRPGQGSSFTLTFPHADKAMDSA